MEEVDLQEIAENIENIENLTPEQISSYADQVKEYLKGQVPTIVAFGIRVILAFIIFFVGRKLIRWLRSFVRKSLDKAGVDTGVKQFTDSLLNIVLYLLLIVTIAGQIGVTESSVAAILGTAGITVGLALQGGLANVAGGVMLLLFKPFQVGDYIVFDQAGGCEGTVEKIEICYTTLLSMDNKHVVIPNGTLSNSTIINVTAKDHRKLEIKVNVSYDSDLNAAKRILEKLLRQDPDTKSDQDMVVFVDELADSSVVLGLRVWVRTDKYWMVKWRLNQQIKEAFDAGGIKIPYQQLDVHVKRDDGQV